MPTPNSDTPVQGPTLEDAAKAFEGMLDREDGTQAPDEEAAKEVPAASEGVAAEAESQETPADEAGGDADEAAEAEDSAEEADPRRPQTIPVTIDGHVEQITLEEAAKSYQRQADYTRKTTELATERQKFAAQQATLREERETYATMLVALQNQLQTGGEPEPDWDEVFRTDPIGYARKRDAWRDKADKLAAASYELQRLQSIKQQEQAEALKQVVATGRQKMTELNPAWKDQTTWETDRQKIVEYAQQVAGYSATEISQAYDPRAIVLLHKARLYDELMANRPKPVTRPGPRVASAGAAPAPGSSRLNAAQQRLARTGSVRDAAKVWEQLI